MATQGTVPAPANRYPPQVGGPQGARAALIHYLMTPPEIPMPGPEDTRAMLAQGMPILQDTQRQLEAIHQRGFGTAKEFLGGAQEAMRYGGGGGGGGLATVPTLPEVRAPGMPNFHDRRIAEQRRLAIARGLRMGLPIHQATAYAATLNPDLFSTQHAWALSPAQQEAALRQEALRREYAMGRTGQEYEQARFRGLLPLQYMQTGAEYTARALPTAALPVTAMREALQPGLSLAQIEGTMGLNMRQQGILGALGQQEADLKREMAQRMYGGSEYIRNLLNAAGIQLTPEQQQRLMDAQRMLRGGGVGAGG